MPKRDDVQPALAKALDTMMKPDFGNTCTPTPPLAPGAAEPDFAASARRRDLLRHALTECIGVSHDSTGRRCIWLRDGAEELIEQFERDIRADAVGQRAALQQEDANWKTRALTAEQVSVSWFEEYEAAKKHNAALEAALRAWHEWYDMLVDQEWRVPEAPDAALSAKPDAGGGT
jgi:hypothetical protein